DAGPRAAQQARAQARVGRARASGSGGMDRCACRRPRPSARAIMTPHLKDFLRFLELNRNASTHTVRAYESDLTQFLACTAVRAGVKRADLDPAQLDRDAVRAFLAEMHRLGQSRATSARKLAAV